MREPGTSTGSDDARKSKGSALQQKVTETVQAVVGGAGMELIELRILRAPRNSWRVQLFIDRPCDEPGVTIDDCASVSRKIGAILEVDDPFPGGWDLEVSSPGMKRRLRGIEDMRFFAGIRARITVRDDRGVKRTSIGALGEVDDESVTLTVDGGKQETVPLAEIERAELDPTVDQWIALGKSRGKGKNETGKADTSQSEETNAANP